MPIVLDVYPVGYTDAAYVLGDLVAEKVRLAWLGLQATLDGMAGMAGSDDVGSSWGASYDAAAASASRTTEDTCNACYQLAALLEQTAINYEGADAASVPGSSARAAANRWAAATTSLGEVPSAVGQGTPQPGGWSLLQHAIGNLWPNGHQDLLRAAAAGWERAAGQLEVLVADIGQAARQVMLQRAPESDDAFTAVDAMAGHMSELASSYRSLGAACAGYAGHLDQAHHQIISEIESFLEWTAGIEAAGGLFSICTFGLSEAAAQAGEAAEIGRAAAAIKSVIETLRGLVAAGRSAVDAAAVRVVALADKLNPIMARRIEAATLKQATEVGILRPGEPLPSEIISRTSATTPEGVALDNLDASCRIRSGYRHLGDLTHFPATLRLHGSDFAATSPADYAAKAASFLPTRDSEKICRPRSTSTGTIRIYDPRTEHLWVVQLRTGKPGLSSSRLARRTGAARKGLFNERALHLPGVRVSRTCPKHSRRPSRWRLVRDLPLVRIRVRRYR